MIRPLHQTSHASVTAQGTCLTRALELRRAPDERIVTDHYAEVFLTAPFRRTLGLLQRATPLVDGYERVPGPGTISTSVLCRHGFIDAHLLEALPDVDQVLILGAGWDSRAYRFAGAIGRRPVIEVDLPPLSRAKRAIVDAHPDVFRRGRAVSVEIDFRTQTLPEQLDGSGFVVGAPTFVVWEGVTMYLTRDAVIATLDTLARLCGPGSTLALDLFRRTAGVGPYALAQRLGALSLGLLGEPVTFAVSDDDVEPLLAGSGFTLLDVAGAADLTRRYATAGRRCDPSLLPVAARLG